MRRRRGTNHCGAAVLTGGLPNIIAVSALQHCSIDVTWGFWFVSRLERLKKRLEHSRDQVTSPRKRGFRGDQETRSNPNLI